MKIPPSDCRASLIHGPIGALCHKLLTSLFTLISLATFCALAAAQATQSTFVISSKPALTLSPDLAQQLASAEGSFESNFPPNWSLGIFMEAADHGSAAGMRDVGLAYIGTYNQINTDNELALTWFERAAIAGDARANSYIGDFYMDPVNGTPDLKTAHYWYEKANTLKDSRGTFELAQMYCTGEGVKKSQPECERLMAEATKFFKTSDPSEARLRIENACNGLGDQYSKGTGVKVNYVASAGWYDKAAVLGLTLAAVSEARIYTVQPGLRQNLARAEAILDAIVAHHNVEPGSESPVFKDQPQVATGYIAIGQQYEAHGPNSMLKAVPVYTKAAKLGNGSAAVKLGLRYLNGTGVRVNLDEAYQVLMGITRLRMNFNDKFALADALDKLADAYSKPTLQAANADRIQTLRQAAMAERIPQPFALAEMAPPPPPGEMTARYPNLMAPDSVPVQQDFAVNVSLNSIAFDANTQILSGQQKDGQLQIQLPLGMSTMPIQVDLIAPGMTFTDGSNSGTLILDATKSDSTPAVFHLRSGSMPANGVLLATLSYHQNFIAQLERKITVVAQPTTDSTPPVVASLPPTPPPIVSTPAPAPSQPDALVRADNSTTLNQGPAKQVGASAPAAHNMMLRAPVPGKPATTALPPPIVLDPTAKTTDLTITETLVQDTMHYSFDSPGLAGTVYADVPMATATKIKVEQMYSQLQNQAVILASGSGAACAADRLKGLGGDTDPNCSDSVNSRALVEGIGNDLYNNLAPQAFRDIYQLLTTNHIRLHTITIVTNSPTLPWELMRPKAADGTSNFLGLTAAIVRENMAAPQLAQPATVPFQSVAIVAPNYGGDLTLNGSTTEVKAIQAYFPQANQVAGDSTSVIALDKNAPQGIIHFTGHSQRIQQKSAAPAPATAITASAPTATSQLAPQVAIELEDESMTPSTFTAIREDGKPTHPFYFFNACFLGRSDPQLYYVDGWAPALMQSGASGYLGALYEVGDTSAVSFASHFYAGLKSNLANNSNWTIADLVTSARKATYAESNDPTALAYVLYTKPYMKMAADN